MKKTKLNFGLITAAAYLTATILLPIDCSATDATARPPQKNYEARIDLGLMYLYSSNNLNPEASSKYISSLDTSAENQSTFRAIPVPTLSYTFEQFDNTKIFLNSRPPIDEAGSFALGFGVSKPIEDVGTPELIIFFTPFVEVWENPYLVNEKREETSTSRYGAFFRMRDMFDTKFGLDLVYLNDDVDDDLIGLLEPDLQRDGNVYAIDTSYSFSPSRAMQIRPILGMRVGEYDGDANSFIKYKVQLEARYRLGKTMVMPKLSYNYSDYNAEDPIFHKTRSENGYGAHLMISHFAPFGYRDWAIQMLLGYKVGDSNIDFYDTEGFTSGIFLSYSL